MSLGAAAGCPGDAVRCAARSRDYLRSCSTCDGSWFACAIIAVPACCRICERASAAVSTAKSASWIRLREAVRFSLEVVRFSIVDEKRFWIAPSAARLELIAVSAASTADERGVRALQRRDVDADEASAGDGDRVRRGYAPANTMLPVTPLGAW